MSFAPHVFVSIVTFNSERYLARCLEALGALEDYSLGENLTVCVVDNASTDETLQMATASSLPIELVPNETNLGFAAAHNQAVSKFLASDAECFLVLNPDVAITPTALRHMVFRVDSKPSIGAVTPLLLRANEELQLLEPARVASAGITMHRSFRRAFS